MAGGRSDDGLETADGAPDRRGERKLTMALLIGQHASAAGQGGAVV